MMVVVAISFTVAGITFMSLMPLLKQGHVDQAYATTLATLRNYRELSVAERKRYILTFAAPGTITVQRWDFALPVSPAPVPVATFTLPSDIQFAVQAGFPNTATTTPDGFGNGGTALGMSPCAVVAQNCLIFFPDGSAQDDQGNFNNGIVYVTRPGDIYSSRSVTVFGSTGRVRGWRLYNKAGVNTWVKQ